MFKLPITAGLASILAAAVYFGGSLEPEAAAVPAPKTMHRTVNVDGLDIFYREAGP